MVKCSKAMHLPSFVGWTDNTFVTESLFEANSSHERKYWGFQLVEKVMNQVPTDQTVFVFTDNFMRTFINNMSSEDRFLSKAARHTVSREVVVIRFVDIASSVSPDRCMRSKSSAARTAILDLV
jgi:hypothetical protein